MSEAQAKPDVRAIPLARLLRNIPAVPPRAQADIRAEIEAVARAQADAEWGRHVATLEAAHAVEIARLGEAATAERALAASLIDALEAQFKDALCTLALAINRQLLHAEPAIPAETLHALIADALAALPEGAAGMLHLSPTDLPHVAAPSGWRLHADPALAPGSLRAESGPALSRASLQLRFDRLAASMEPRR